VGKPLYVVDKTAKDIDTYHRMRIRGLAVVVPGWVAVLRRRRRRWWWWWTSPA
jgi:hypothetical protein